MVRSQRVQREEVNEGEAIKARGFFSARRRRDIYCKQIGQDMRVERLTQL